MPALSVTASQVLASADATIATGIAAEAITAGQVCFLDSTTNTYKLFDANVTALNAGHPVVALNGAAAGQRLSVQSGGTLTIGAAAAPTVGVVYVAGATPGDIAPAADITTNWRVAIIGVGASASAIKLMLGNSGATSA